MRSTPPLAVCSWSLQPSDPRDLVSKLKKTGLHRIQLALDPLRENPVVWGEAVELLAKAGVSIVSGMFGCVGEDYSTLDSIRVTGGLGPDQHWDENLKNIRATLALAQRLKLQLVTFHAGFLPHDETAADFTKMLVRLATVADLFRKSGLDLGFETGQETAESLAHVLQMLNRPNVGVNFDPANMLLYDKGNPVEALQVLGPWLKQVHIKDAIRTKTPGTWGQEVAVGTGEVDWPAFFSILKSLSYSGNYVLEREAGGQRIADLRIAITVVERNFSH